MNNRHRELVDGYCSGTLNDTEFNELQEALRKDAELRRLLIEYRMLDSDLRSYASAAPQLSLVSPGGEQKTGTKRGFRLELLAAAAVILALVGTLIFLPREDSGPTDTAGAEPVDHGVAVVTRSIDAQWKGRQLRPGDSVEPGRLELAGGVVELEFYSGASVILEAPADFEIVSKMAGVLHQGKLSARVPPQAIGFTITTKEVLLVDLGTEFGVEATPDSGTSVHVIKGKVELFDPKVERKPGKGKKLTAGQGQLVKQSGESTDIPADPEKFISPAELAKKEQERLDRAHKRWRKSMERLAIDPHVMALYDFEPEPDNPRTLVGRSRNAESDGAIVGSRWKWGRWRFRKRALDFNSPAHRVRIEVPGTPSSVTLSLWVRIDRLDRQYNVLLASEAWDREGAVHWRFQNRGSIQLQVNNGLSHQYCNSTAPFILKPSDFGRWMHLVAVYDDKKQQVFQYRDGELLGTAKLRKVVPVQIGRAEIGNWTGTGKGSRQVRHLNGRIDELVIFDQVLTQDEIRRLYRSGTP
jgi:hypothetical protein